MNFCLTVVHRHIGVSEHQQWRPRLNVSLMTPFGTLKTIPFYSEFFKKTSLVSQCPVIVKMLQLARRCYWQYCQQDTTCLTNLINQEWQTAVWICYYLHYWQTVSRLCWYSTIYQMSFIGYRFFFSLFVKDKDYTNGNLSTCLQSKHNSKQAVQEHFNP